MLETYKFVLDLFAGVALVLALLAAGVVALVFGLVVGAACKWRRRG
jgi:hypothetical protein